ncbi:hypothetical protein DFH27DRAFT_566588 [Peziza echinospora]|nr:hypothetical protein DFH27DRAFT_566588 [Peziza echinospora]
MENFLSEFDECTQEDRAKIITQLSTHFRPSEWWLVNKLLVQRGGQFDIITALPLELVAQVLQDIPLLEIFTKRRVSRGWNQLLSSESVCRALFANHYPKKPLNTVWKELSRTDALLYDKSWKLLLEDITSRRENFHRGLVCKTLPNLDLTFASDNPHPLPLAPICRNGKLATYTQDLWGSTLIAVYNVPDDLKCIFAERVPNREDCFNIGLTQNMVFTLTHVGNCHAWDLATRERKSLRLEGANASELFCFDRSVVIIYPTYVIRWDTKDNKTLRFNLCEDLLSGQHPIKCWSQNDDFSKIFFIQCSESNDIHVHAIDISPDSDITRTRSKVHIWNWFQALNISCPKGISGCRQSLRLDRPRTGHLHPHVRKELFQMDSGTIGIPFLISSYCSICLRRRYNIIVKFSAIGNDGLLTMEKHLIDGNHVTEICYGSDDYVLDRCSSHYRLTPKYSPEKTYVWPMETTEIGDIEHPDHGANEVSYSSTRNSMDVKGFSDRFIVLTKTLHSNPPLTRIVVKRFRGIHEEAMKIHHEEEWYRTGEATTTRGKTEQEEWEMTSSFIHSWHEKRERQKSTFVAREHEPALTPHS